jgi:hypothetical protein
MPDKKMGKETLGEYIKNLDNQYEGKEKESSIPIR